MKFDNPTILCKEDMIELALSIANHLPDRIQAAACLAECIEATIPNLAVEQKQKLLYLLFDFQAVLNRHFPQVKTSTADETAATTTAEQNTEATHPKA